jgi:hypothetical protein
MRLPTQSNWRRSALHRLRPFIGIAIRVCEVRLANNLMQRLTKLYDLDAWGLRERTWTRLSQTAASAKPVLVKDAMQLADQAIREAAAAQEAFDRLLMAYDDAEASHIVGRFRCFDKQDSETGLPFLVRRADEDLRELAERESRHVSSAAGSA